MSETDAGVTRGGLVDRVKGTAKQVAGAITGNDDLNREGELHGVRRQLDGFCPHRGHSCLCNQTHALIDTREEHR